MLYIPLGHAGALGSAQWLIRPSRVYSPGDNSVYILTHNFLFKKVYLYKFFVLDKTTPSFRSTSGTHSVKKNPVKQPSSPEVLLA